MTANIQKLQEMFPLVEVDIIKQIVMKNPGQKIYTEAIPHLKLIQEYKEYKESVNPSLNIAPPANEGDVPLTNIDPQMNDILLKTNEKPAYAAASSNYHAINSENTGNLDFNPLYQETVCCECCCGDPRKPKQPQWICDCRECCKCCSLLPDDNNYNGTKNTESGGFLYEKDVKLFMSGFLILIVMSMPAEIAYDTDVKDAARKNLFTGPASMFITLIAVVLYFMKCAVGRTKNVIIACLLLVAAILYLSSYIYHTLFLKDFTPDCSNWLNNHDCSWFWYDDYCGNCICADLCNECTDGFGENYENCYHFEKSYFVSRGIYIAVIMGLLGLHFIGIRNVISSRIGYIKFMIIILTFYSICIGGVTAGNYYYQIVFCGCPSFVIALLLFISYFLIGPMNKNLRYKGGCNGIISIATLLFVFLIWNIFAQIVTTAVIVANWDNDKGIWLWCWELSITVFGLFNFIIFFRALHPCTICKTCNC